MAENSKYKCNKSSVYNKV